MSKRRSQPVKPPKDKRAASLHVGVITVEQQRKMRKARERQERIALEREIRPTGAGAHGGNSKRDINRKARRQAKLETSGD
ncbi:MAG: hypothetical protein KGS72_18445 [Cyanobacteria bacterium REEB67]|nr:hypothetical protein [Cyanobacteria bacterium REEB67]